MPFVWGTNAVKIQFFFCSDDLPQALHQCSWLSAGIQGLTHYKMIIVFIVGKMCRLIQVIMWRKALIKRYIVKLPPIPLKKKKNLRSALVRLLVKWSL